MIQEAIQKLVEGGSLSMEQAAAGMNEIMDGEATPAQFGAFVTALRMKGETPDEIAGMAQVMREKSLHVVIDGALVDTCGTGGDASHTFNISTSAAFVAAGAGLKVAKHGNRAMSGSSGSADVLEALGVKIDLSPESVARCLNEVGFGFMFAQRYHPSMRFAAGPRREIGIRTVFNMLGPLTNPAGARSQVIGVADATIGEKMAQVLLRLGSKHALVVHGADGMDEITVAGPSRIWEVKAGAVEETTVRPEDFGIPSAERKTIQVSSVIESAEVLRGVLAGNKGPARDVVLLNAAAGLLAADAVPDIPAGIELAARSIDTGRARASMDALVKLSQTLE